MTNQVQDLFSKSNKSLFIIAGPCAIESVDTAFVIAKELKHICQDLNIPFVYKSSFRKANRTKLESFVSIGDDEAIDILRKVRNTFQIPVCTDVHETNDIDKVSEIDMLQIPAFLCRQTDLLIKAGETKKPINIKKGQFMSASSMNWAVQKVKSTGNEYVAVTERGTMFGYNDLIVDPRGIFEMSKYNCTIVDVTHSNQKMNNELGVTQGDTRYCELYGKIAIASGAKGLFFETHPDPQHAKSDAQNMIPIHRVKPLLEKWKEFYRMHSELYGVNNRN